MKSVRQGLLACALCSKEGLSCGGTRVTTAQQCRQGHLFGLGQGVTCVDPVPGECIFLLSHEPPRSLKLSYLTLPIQIVQPLAWPCKACELLIPDFQLHPFRFWSRSLKSKRWLARMRSSMVETSRTGGLSTASEQESCGPLVYCCYHNNCCHRRQGGFDHKNVFSHSCGIWNSKIKVSAESISPEPSPVACTWPSSPCPHAIFPLCEFVSRSLTVFISVSCFCKHDSHSRLRPSMGVILP